jgi:hypothetical protein
MLKTVFRTKFRLQLRKPGLSLRLASVPPSQNRASAPQSARSPDGIVIDRPAMIACAHRCEPHSGPIESQTEAGNANEQVPSPKRRRE